MKILIVGLGSIGIKHLHAIQKIFPSVVIYALRSSSKLDIVEGVTNVKSYEDLNEIDFAIISTPTSLHKHSIQEILFLNCPLFIEKPLYHTLDIAEIVEQVEKMGILNYVACNLRFLECLKFLKEEVQKNIKKINEINVYCGSYLPDWRPNVDYRNIYSSDPERGGGVHLDLIHELDYLYWIWGEPVNVTRIFKRNSSLNIRAYDYANYCLAYNHFCANVILNYYRRDPKRSIEIVFDDCTWDVDIINNRIICNSNVIFESQQRIKDTYEDQLSYFIDLVQTRKTSSGNSIGDAFKVLKICLES